MKKNLILLTILLFMAQSIVTVFLPLYIKQTGANGFLLGLLLSIPFIAALLFQNLWGIITDKLTGTRASAVIASFVCVAATIVFFLDSRLLTFSIIYIFFSVFFLPLIPIASAVSEKSGKYGKIRLWGTVGFIFSSLVGGVIFSSGGKNLFIYLGATMFLAALVSFRLPKRVFDEKNHEKGVLRKVISSKAMMIELAVIFLLNVAVSFQGAYFGIYFVTVLGNSGLLFGVVSALRYLLEIPFFFFSEKLYEKLGAKKLMISAVFLSAARMLIVGLFANTVVIIVAVLLLGASYAPAQYCIIRRGAAIAGNGNTQIQSVNTLFNDFPRIFGVLFGASAVAAFGYGSVSLVIGLFLIAVSAIMLFIPSVTL